MRFFLFLFLFLFSFILAHGEEYVFSKLFDSDFRQVDSSHPLCLNLKGRMYNLGFFKDFYGNSTISLLINGNRLVCMHMSSIRTVGTFINPVFLMPAVPPYMFTRINLLSGTPDYMMQGTSPRLA